MPHKRHIDPAPPASMAQFYELMGRTRDVRAGAVLRCLDGRDVKADDITALRNARTALESIPRGIDGYAIALDSRRQVSIDLSYEIGELIKDLVYLEKGEEALLEHVGSLVPNFGDQVRETVEKLRHTAFRNFMTDRDGTVNNYCARYLTSIQSVYNAVFLTRFAKNCVDTAVILTSAPLRNGGIVDISTAPAGAFVYAGSKGREYYDRHGTYGSCPIAPRQQAILDTFNARLEQLLARDGNGKFALIGSGLQKKFGQTTISRQDINGSVDEEESAAFRGAVAGVVDEIDPDHTDFRIEDTGLDLEIILTVGGDGDGPVKDFDKSHSVRFLDEALGLGISQAPVLVCGDTNSDVPMVRGCAAGNKGAWAVFSTTNDELKQKVRDESANCCFVSAPDVLVVSLNELSKLR